MTNSRSILPAAAFLLATACGGSGEKDVGTVSQSINGVPRPDHTMVVIMENTSFSTVSGSSSAPYINSLIGQGANFTDSHAVSHPSEPNYLALFSGSTQGVTSDACPLSFGTTANLGSEVIAAGLSFTAYSEDLPSAGSTVCTAGTSGYARKHDPWVNFSNVPAASQQPYTSFPSTSFASLPTVSFVVPNLCDDMHDCSVQTGDTWLKNNIDGYVQWAKTHNSLLILTWDEDDSTTSANQIPTVFVGQMVKQGNYGENISHYNVLHTIEDMYGLAPIGNAASAPSIADAWSTSVASDFALAVTPSTLSVAQGSTGTATASTSIVSGSAESVALSASGLPTGVTAGFSPASVSGAASSTLSLAVSSSVAAGTYPVTLTGTAASGAHSVNLTLVVNAVAANDFSVAVSPGTVTLIEGSTGTATVSTAIVSGSAESIALSASSVPAGVTASFSPASVTGAASSTLTLSAASSAVAGTYAIAITGTAAAGTHTATVSLVVTPATSSGLTNGGFETGTFAGWTTSGTTSIVSSGAHGGTYAARLGSTSPTNGDSSAVQSFTAPAGVSGLSFWYKVVCPDTVQYDWATATLADTTAGTTTTVLAKVCTNAGAWTNATAAVTPGHNYTLTLVSHDDNYAGDPTYTLYDDVALVTLPPPPPPQPLQNGGFETGSLSGWTASGTTGVVASGAHSGTYAAKLGATSPTNGDSSIAQTFTVPTGATQLSFWYAVTCPDTVQYDWATATLKNDTTGATSTVLAKVCTKAGSWTQVTAPVIPGDSYTLTLVSHDDNYAGDPTYTLFDDVAVQ